jgi:2-methylcitrate dehydratase PrpD
VIVLHNLSLPNPSPVADPIASVLAGFCRGVSFQAMPPQLVERALELVLDHIAVTLGGRAQASTVAINDFVSRSGGPGRASVLAAGLSTAPAWAALANGTAAHAIEMDDCTRASSLHPGVSVIPAALGVAEELDADMAAFLEAVVVGYEVVMRVGTALGPESTYRRGFHPTGIAGALGAAAASGRLLNLDVLQFANALGIAGTMASGSLEYLSDGSWTKRLNPGWAAHAGVTAAGLAASGFTGPMTVLEGPLGLLHAHSDAGDPRPLLAGLGDGFELMKVSIKPYACCRYSHGLIDCMLDIRAQHAIAPSDVKAIELGVLSVGSVLIAEPIERKRHPETVVDAQFSAPFAAAVALLYGDTSLSAFTAARLADPSVRSLMERTTCYRDPDLDARYPVALPADVRVVLADDRVLTAHVDYPLGEPEHPLSREMLIDRFVTLAGASLGDAEARGYAPRFMRSSGGSSVRATIDPIRRVR